MQTDWVRRYIYAVTKELPETQRTDIEKELRGLIEDMLEERLHGREATNQEIESVLFELGNPQELADKYRERKRYLIGPEMFPSYVGVLKIVALAISIAMLVLFIIQTIQQPDQIVSTFVNTLFSFLAACFQGFAWVTITFGATEYFGLRDKDVDLNSGKQWKVSDLPEISDERNTISSADPILSIVFQIFFAALLILSVDTIGVWMFLDGQPATVVPFFSEPVFRAYLPLILVSLGLDVVFEIAKLAVRRWTLKLVAFEFLTIFVHLMVGLIVFTNPQIWNPDFVAQISQASSSSVSPETLALVNNIWTGITANMIYFIGLGVILELISTIVKLVRLPKTA